MKTIREMMNLMEGVMAVPGLAQGSVGGAGGAEANMQTIASGDNNQADAEFDAAQTPTTEEAVLEEPQSPPQVASCRQSNPASAREACAMEENAMSVSPNYEKFQQRFTDLMNSFVEPEEAVDVITNEMDQFGLEAEEIDVIMTAIEAEFLNSMEVDEPVGSFDFSDDADALASAGHGSDEDYGSFGPDDFDDFEFDEAFDSPLDEAYDLQNGYHDIRSLDGQDYFPNGADGPVVDKVGPSGAKQGDNPEQKKMQIAEVHKELVYGYRNYLKESTTTVKK